MKIKNELQNRELQIKKIVPIYKYLKSLNLNSLLSKVNLNKKVFIAYSGGVDSTVLLHVFYELSKVNKINFDDPEKGKNKIAFDILTQLYPNETNNLEVETNKIEKKQ